MSSSSIIEGQDPFSVSSTKVEWPLRLLHVPTMTSLHRIEDKIYMDSTSGETFTDPKYNALSYTWGRWACKEGPAIHVENITWQVPPVSGDRFSVEEFYTVIQRASKGVLFLWVDIACIDQEDEPTKMFEVGRQAGIFNGARESYIWLHSLSSTELQTQAGALFDLATELENEVVEGTPAAASNSEDELDDSGDSSFAIGSNTLGSEKWCTSVAKILSAFEKEFWFTSLWTLQEMYLRPDAILLSRDASTATRPDGLEHQEVHLANLVIHSNTIYDAITKHFHQSKFSPDILMHRGLLQEIVCSIQRLGFEGAIFNNPCSLYSASCHRTAFNINDRIYGIMQVFNLKLGSAREPSKTFTLKELEIQLGAALNA